MKDSVMKDPNVLTLFLCGDVMLGRGIDQILPFPSAPTLHEGYLTNALQYVELAEKENGPIARPVNPKYIWGEALKHLSLIKPDARIINLETSITISDDWVPKGINYRMNPANIKAISDADIDVCVLANNHTLDWGIHGLKETLATLHREKILTSGAGLNLNEAMAPAIIQLENKNCRLLVFSIATKSSGVPEEWTADESKPGINYAPDLSSHTISKLNASIQDWKQPGDIIILSIHWGGNWGYSIPKEHSFFAHQMIDRGVDVLYGHSSHHVKGIEIYREKLILYGCGDFINDYEGIKNYEEFRSDLPVMFFPRIDIPTGKLIELKLVPLHLKNFALHTPQSADLHWIEKTLNREGKGLGTHFEVQPDFSLVCPKSTGI